MQLIVAIVQDNDVGRLTEALGEEGFQTTKVASTGGFLKSYNTTLLIGCEEDRVDDALDIIKKIRKKLKSQELHTRCEQILICTI